MATAWNFNLPLMSIPAYYFLAVYPHGHAVIVASKGNLNNHDNRNPMSAKSIESRKRKLTPKEFAAWERAERCHSNHMENMPLFVAAIFAGLLAEAKGGADAVGLNNFAVGWMVIRVLYTINYIRTETVAWSFVRTLLYYMCSLWAFWVIGQSAFVLGPLV